VNYQFTLRWDVFINGPETRILPFYMDNNPSSALRFNLSLQYEPTAILKYTHLLMLQKREDVCFGITTPVFNLWWQ